MIRGASPGPGAVTMLSRPDPISTMPVATVTPDFDPGYGAKLVKISGALPISPGSVDENILDLGLDSRTRPHDDVVGQRISVDVGTGDVHTAPETGIERRKAGQLGG